MAFVNLSRFCRNCGYSSFQKLMRSGLNRSGNSYVFSRSFAATKEPQVEEKAEVETVEFSKEFDLDEELLEDDLIEAEMARLQDISRLPRHLRVKLFHRQEVPEVYSRHQFNRTYKRGLFGRMGKASEVHPSLLYPFQEELDEMIEERNLFEPTLEELIASAQAKVDEEAAERKAKEELVERNMANMPKWIEKFKEQQLKQDAVERQISQKSKDLLDEAREFYGYSVDQRDPRFAQMLEMKEEAERLERRKQRKARKEASTLSTLLKLQEKAKKEREAALLKAAQMKEQQEAGAAEPEAAQDQATGAPPT